MNDRTVRTCRKVILVGGGSVQPSVLKEVLAQASHIVAADGGAKHVLDAGFTPHAVFGDMDSLSAADQERLPPEVLHHVAEQDSTDFDKCLRHIEATLVLGYGFLGQRLDHQLAAMNVLVRRAHQPCILVGRHDAVVHCPPELRLTLPMGARFSLFPMAPVRGRSAGLRWPIDGIDFAPAGVIGTSNEVCGPVSVAPEREGMVAIVPVESLDALVSAVQSAPRWPVRA
ncbi:thiamine diphosphokinase [Sagittula sp. SSi028]|uniref:thiamine diphosphokinase n=1 Tax=Sagittula sp. SSi028 TaxID=3400636 RepID=UPI003AF44EAF